MACSRLSTSCRTASSCRGLSQPRRSWPTGAAAPWTRCARGFGVAAVRLSSQASKDFAKLARSDRQLFERVDAALTRLGEEPTIGKPLQGPLAGLRSLRVGDLRIIYRREAAQ